MKKIAAGPSLSFGSAPAALSTFVAEGRYNGRSILLLFSESNVDLYKLKLSDSCNLVLEKLLSVSFLLTAASYTLMLEMTIPLLQKHAPPKDEVDTSITPGEV